MDPSYSDESHDCDSSGCGGIIQCYCQDHCPFGDGRGTCTIKPGGQCFTAVESEIDEDGNEDAVLSYGCLPAEEMALMQCKASQVPHAQSKSIQCCNVGNLCNKNLYPMYNTDDTATNSEDLTYGLLIASLAFYILILMSAIIIGVVVKCRKKIWGKAHTVEILECDLEQYGMENNIDNDIRENEIIANCESLGVANRGSSTIAKQIQMKKCIGEGRYGEVWLGKWREGKVAVKIFPTIKVQYWHRETQIYQTVLMRHDNILGFIAADVQGIGKCTQLLLITDYHHYGTLLSFLQNNTLIVSSLLCMSRSIASGLAYLHADVCGVQDKPSMAHRDLHSKHILVKSNGECCISSFELAVKSNSNFARVLPRFEEIGTTRYMAPEILDGSFDSGNFEAYKMADMYSFGLVLWEMTNRCVIEDDAPLDHALPFYDLVTNDPSLEVMKDVVCLQKIRPPILKVWNSVDVLKMIVKVMQELWHSNPAVRLTALRVKKTLIEHKSSISVDRSIELKPTEVTKL